MRKARRNRKIKRTKVDLPRDFGLHAARCRSESAVASNKLIKRHLTIAVKVQGREECGCGFISQAELSPRLFELFDTLKQTGAI